MTPNLFILGAAKSGTTSLHHILGQHPDIHASRVKEPSFFCSHFQVVSNPVTYFDLFDSQAPYRMEASHVYFSNPETSQILKDLFPDAKFLLTLRRPEERAYSLYRHMRRSLHPDGRPFEELPSFCAALRAEAERATSPAFFAECRQYFWNFLYCRSSLYDEQLARYLALFPRERFHVSTLAELAADPLGVTERILTFLDLDPAPAAAFDLSAINDGGPHESWCEASERYMDEMFDGLTERTERLVGHALDWSR